MMDGNSDDDNQHNRHQQFLLSAEGISPQRQHRYAA
jgi:hypothetical protein